MVRRSHGGRIFDAYRDAPGGPAPDATERVVLFDESRLVSLGEHVDILLASEGMARKAIAISRL